jgi:hypothetical protein
VTSAGLLAEKRLDSMDTDGDGDDDKPRVRESVVSSTDIRRMADGFNGKTQLEAELEAESDTQSLWEHMHDYDDESKWFDDLGDGSDSDEFVVDEDLHTKLNRWDGSRLASSP